jgi:hypothetical protein
MPTGVIPTIATQEIGYVGYVDVSLESPDAQFQALSDMLAADDAANPSPNSNTPPWGEPTPESEYLPEAVLEESYIPLADVAQPLDDEEVLSVISDAPTSDIPEWDWENDDQYYGLGVPPGVPNYGQPIESGHTQITVPNPSAELGWDAWSGKFTIARVARHENGFSRYNAGTSRGHMLPIADLQDRNSAVVQTNQVRDLLLAEVKKRGVHNVVVDTPLPVPYTDQVVAVDPQALAVEPDIGPEGVLP